MIRTGTTRTAGHSGYTQYRVNPARFMQQMVLVKITVDIMCIAK